MKLDSKIMRRPFTPWDSKEFVQFIRSHNGKMTIPGYFANSFQSFCDLSNLADFDAEKGVLTALVDNQNCDCEYPFSPGNDKWYQFFLPCEWVKEKEPEPIWKPYDLDSWRNDGFMIGSAITFRIKPKKGQDSKNTIVKTMVYLGDEEHSDNLNDIYIYIGTLGYSFKYLFENYEIFDDKYAKSGCPKWRPFGYQE